MKKRFAVCLILALILALAACGSEGAHNRDKKPKDDPTTQIIQTDPTEDTKSTTQPTVQEDSTQPTVQEEQTKPTESESVPEEEGYLQRIERPDQSIYDGPGYDYGFVGVVEQASVYTIMEEKKDDEGNLWGRLKSGIGWVDLTEVRARNEAKELVSANFADKTLLKSGKFHEFILEESEYLEKLAFRCYEDVTDVTFTWLVWNGESMEVDKVLHTIPELKAGEAFVAGVVFYGDMTMFGLSFVDGGGVTHYYSASVSGRNGSLVFTEYQP